MRIVGGEFRGRALAPPPGRGTRPTSDRARQAVFNILEHAPWAPGLQGRRVIDLFAGSGALGFEAVSRGAVFCLFVETDEAARGAIRDTVEALGLFGRTRIHRRDATDLGLRPGSAGEAFDLAFLDPPYRQGLGERCLTRLAEGGWLTPEALLVLEDAVDAPAAQTPGFEELDARDYGVARVRFLRWSPAAG
jgi:16S rRNA (guanine966-N2)-methyltransferase